MLPEKKFMVINAGFVDSKFVVGCYKLHKDFFFLVFIVDYNHCALNSKQAIEARTLKIRKERLSQCRPSRSSQPLLSCKANSAV